MHVYIDFAAKHRHKKENPESDHQTMKTPGHNFDIRGTTILRMVPRPWLELRLVQRRNLGRQAQVPLLALLRRNPKITIRLKKRSKMNWKAYDQSFDRPQFSFEFCNVIVEGLLVFLVSLKSLLNQLVDATRRVTRFHHKDLYKDFCTRARKV